MAVGGGTGAKMQAYNDAAFETYNTKALEPCPNCARTFLPESLVKHQKFCKGGQAMQSMNNRRTLNPTTENRMLGSPTGGNSTS